jgi:hypothetical protein
VLVYWWCHVFSVSCKIVCLWITSNCCSLSEMCPVPRQLSTTPELISARARACLQFARCMPWRRMGECKTRISFWTTAIYLVELPGSRPGRFTSGKEPRMLVEWGTYGLQSRSGCLEAEKPLTPDGIQTPYHPTYSLVTALTTPFRLFQCDATRMKMCYFYYGVFHLHHKTIARWESKCCILICLTVVTYILYGYIAFNILCVGEVCLNGAFLNCMWCKRLEKFPITLKCILMCITTLCDNFINSSDPFCS